MIKGIFLKSMFNTKECYIKLEWFTIFIERNENWKVQKIMCSLKGKKEYVVHIQTLKQVSQKGHGVIKFDQQAWLKRYIHMNAELKKC